MCVLNNLQRVHRTYGEQNQIDNCKGITHDAKYFSSIIDSTHDLSHMDQLTFVSRGNHISNHTSENLADCDVSVVQDLGLNLANHCR